MNKIKFTIGGGERELTAVNGQLSKTDKHYITDKSLRWDYGGEGASLRFYDGRILPEGYTEHGEIIENYDFVRGFSCYIYSETATGDILEFRFFVGDKLQQSFRYIINFTGWRNITMHYERGFMKGEFSPDINAAEIKIHSSGGGGTVFLDEINPALSTRPTHYYGEMSQHVKHMPRHTRRGVIGTYEDNGNHLNRPLFPLPDKITDEDIAAFEDIERKYLEIHNEIDLPPLGKNQMTYEKAVEIYNSFNISYTEDGYIRAVRIGDSTPYIRAMKALAINYASEKNEADFNMYMDMLKLLDDQHISINWYNGRGMGTSMLILKEELKRHGVLDYALNYLKDAYVFNRIYNVTSVNGLAGKRFEDTDVIGMELPTMLVCILLMNDTPEKLRDMNHFIDYIENTCLEYAPGTESGYKPDGTSFHHGAYVLQYNIVAQYSMARVIYALSGGKFMLSQRALDRFKYYIDTKTMVTNACFETFSAAQYFLNDKKSVSASDLGDFAAATGNREMAALFMKMADDTGVETDGRLYNKFASKGITPSEYPEGHKTLSYSAMAVHRRKNWMAAVKAWSKYVIYMEVWPDATHPSARYSAFSLFRAFGSLELMGKPSPEEGNNNGVHINEGFDYRRWNGSTSVMIPYGQFKSRVYQTEDDCGEWLLGDQAFVGGLDSSDGNGSFALKLHGPVKYGLDSFYANKTYHFHDDMILCVGSDITNDIPYETETTLFQDFGSGAVRDGNYLEDNRGHGYWVIDGGEKIKFFEKENHSRDLKDREDTVGNRTFALISHGVAPDGEKYVYLIKMEGGINSVKSVKNNIEILQNDEAAHIVKMFDTTDYVMFRKNLELNTGIIGGVTESCIMSVQKNADGSTSLAICDPDLRLYNGESEDYDINRKFIERSAYSRRWGNRESIASKIWVVVKKEINDFKCINGNAKIIQRSNGSTIVEFICKDGLTNEIRF